MGAKMSNVVFNNDSCPVTVDSRCMLLQSEARAYITLYEQKKYINNTEKVYKKTETDRRRQISCRQMGEKIIQTVLLCSWL